MNQDLDRTKALRGGRGSFRREIARVLRGRGRRTTTPPTSVPPRSPPRVGGRLAVAGMLLVLLVAVGCENIQKTQRCVLSGLVLDTSGNRVTGAVITSHRSLYSAVTGSDGRYSFTSLDAGNHKVTVERSGYRTASRTATVDNGIVVENFDFRLEPLPNRINWNVFKREKTQVTIDVSTAEPMTCVAVYQGEHQPQIRTAPSPVGSDLRFILGPLLPDVEYRLFVEGTTLDGRVFSSATGTFRPVPANDLPGAPPMPDSFSVSQSNGGPKLSWTYPGADPLKGFRLYRAEGDKELALWQNEDFVFPTQQSVLDDSAVPGVRVRYAVESVDLDGNISSRTAEITIFPAGKLKTDVTWKKSWSPIDLQGDIWVPSRTSFTIEPGTVVRVNPADLSQGGYDPNKVEIIVEGRLLVSATGSALVRFFSSSSRPTRSDWAGFRLRTEKGQQPGGIVNLQVSNAQTGILMVDTPDFVASFSASYCETGFELEGASGTVLRGLSFSECETGLLARSCSGCSLSRISCNGGDQGIILTGNRSTDLRNFDLRNLIDTGLTVDEIASTTVKGGVIHASTLGMLVRSGAAVLKFLTIDSQEGVSIDGADQPDLRNCIIENRKSAGTGNGIVEKTKGRNYPYNNIHGFKTQTVNCGQDGGPILNLDPRFVGESSAGFDYHLRGDSPLKLAADDKSEMGAYGFPADN